MQQVEQRDENLNLNLASALRQSHSNAVLAYSHELGTYHVIAASGSWTQFNGPNGPVFLPRWIEFQVTFNVAALTPTNERVTMHPVGIVAVGFDFNQLVAWGLEWIAYLHVSDDVRRVRNAEAANQRYVDALQAGNQAAFQHPLIRPRITRLLSLSYNM